jgi:hypothetical protein
VKWIYDAEEKSWQHDGVVTDIPAATKTQPGLLSAQLKQLVDSISPKGGHFGIITRPLLSVVPINHESILKDSVQIAYAIASGTTIRANSPFEISAFEENVYVGKLLRFTSGILRDRMFLISENTDSEITILGTANHAKPKDKFEIIEPTALNLNGVIAGNIELVSESIDIECVDADNNQIDQECNPSSMRAVDGRLPALDFKIGDLFKSTFCAQQPGCEGVRGDKGPKGLSGADGTGDGPQGEAGDPGIDAPNTPIQLDGVKIIDIDDIYDTAVIAVEVNQQSGKLNIVKAKIRTPDDNTPANQLITTEVFREIEFTGDGFGFSLLKPPVDPIGTEDVKIAYYPQGFEIPSGGGINKPLTTPVSVMDLSGLLNEMCNFWQVKLDQINDDFNQQIKTFIESKDDEVRKNLAQLCQELSECEWEKPIEFCIGTIASNCNPGDDLQLPPGTPTTPPPPGGPPGGPPPPPPPPPPGGGGPVGVPVPGPGIPIEVFLLPPLEGTPVNHPGPQAPEGNSPDIGAPVPT